MKKEQVYIEKNLTVKKAKEAIEEIEIYAEDNNDLWAHYAEIDFQRAVLASIMNGSPHARTLARLALKVARMDLKRCWEGKWGSYRLEACKKK